MDQRLSKVIATSHVVGLPGPVDTEDLERPGLSSRKRMREAADPLEEDDETITLIPTEVPDGRCVSSSCPIHSSSYRSCTTCFSPVFFGWKDHTKHTLCWLGY
ncbi:hypothetical protein FKM82_011760 [Ascaphus truei]